VRLLTQHSVFGGCSKPTMCCQIQPVGRPMTTTVNANCLMIRCKPPDWSGL